MNVLFVTLHFPPEDVIASLRTGHIAVGLAGYGDEVTVATRHPPEGGLEMHGLDNLKVIAASDPSERWRRRVDQSLSHDAAHRRSPWSPRTRVRRFLKAISRAIPPDRYIWWAIRIVRKAKGVPTPDVVLVSVPPMSALLVAALLARRHRAPLVVDYRDSLVNNPYNELARPLQLLQRGFEWLLTRNAAHITSVSQPLVDELTDALGLPGTVVMNGFDPADFAECVDAGAYDDALVVTFCGYLHEGKSDPAPLFEAVSIARDFGCEIRLRFVGPNSHTLEPLVKSHRLDDVVTLRPKVEHAESVRLQRSSDVLLQLSRQDSADKAVVGGKLLEYMGAGRPILLVGYEQSVAADLIREHGLGVASTDPKLIAQTLVQWSQRKKDAGRLPPIDTLRLTEYTRQHQTGVLRNLLRLTVED